MAKIENLKHYYKNFYLQKNRLTPKIFLLIILKLTNDHFAISNANSNVTKLKYYVKKLENTIKAGKREKLNKNEKLMKDKFRLSLTKLPLQQLQLKNFIIVSFEK